MIMDIDKEQVKNYLMRIERDVKEIGAERREAKSEYETKINELDNRLREVQNRCPHFNYTYHPDPSGNNDSWESCNICGKKSKRL